MAGKLFENIFRIQSSQAGPVWQIWVSGPVRSGNSYAQSGRALQLALLNFALSETEGKTHQMWFFYTTGPPKLLTFRRPCN